MPSELDAYTRNQIYVEGYKNGEATNGDAAIDALIAAIVLAATKLGVENLGELTRRQMRAFITEVTRIARDQFNTQADITTENLRKFMEANARVNGAILAELTGDFPSAVVNYDTLWTNINNAPMPGVGIEQSTIMSVALAGIIAELQQTIKIGFADKLDIPAFIRSIVGTANNKFKDGVAKRIKRRLSSTIQTAIQHIAAEVAFKLGSLKSREYLWCSILDSRTTDICRERNGKVYEYVNGPRPPAHWNCRSFVIPITTVNLADLPTFYTWVQRQPARVQDDILGPARGRGLREGTVKSDDIPGFERARPLTVEQYEDSLTQILSEVA